MPNIMVCATIGKASSLVNSCTDFSPKGLLDIPLYNHTYSPLLYQLLLTMQYILKDLKFLVTNKFSMLRARSLFHMELRLQKIIMKPDISFGGVCVLLWWVGLLRCLQCLVIQFGIKTCFLMWYHKSNLCGDF